MAHKDHHVARDIARALRYLSHLDDAVMVFQGGQLQTLANMPRRAPDTAALASALLQPSVPVPAKLAGLLGASHTSIITPGMLGKTAYHLKATAPSPRLKQLLGDGHKPLRSWTMEAIEGLRGRVERDLAQMSALHHCLEAASAPPESALWVMETLALRASSLCGRWPAAVVAQGWDERLVAALEPSLSQSAPEPLRRWARAVLLHHGHRGDWERHLPAALQRQARRLSAFSVETLVILLGEHGQKLVSLAVACRWPEHLHESACAALGLEAFYGPEAAAAALELLLAPWGRVERVRVPARLGRFVQLVQRSRVAVEGGGNDDEEEELLGRLQRLKSRDCSDRLAALFARWSGEELGGDVHPVELERAAEAHLGQGLEAMTQAMVRVWLGHARRRRDATFPTERWRRSVLEVVLSQPGMRWPGEAPKAVWCVSIFGSCLVEIEDGDAARQAWSWLQRHRDKLPRKRLDDMGVPRLDHVRALVLGLEEWMLHDFVDVPSERLQRYLALVERLKAHRPDLIDADSQWLRGLFAAGTYRFDSALTLTFLNRANKGQDFHGRVERLHAVVRVLERQGRALVGPLEAWEQVRVNAPPEPHYSALKDALGVEAHLLDTYLHHRREAGFGESFSAALLEGLEGERKRASQARWLRAALDEPGVDGAKRAALTRRLESLTDPQRNEGRLAALRQRQRNRLMRATERLKVQSLERCLRGATHKALEGLVGEPIGERELPAGFDAVVLLLPAEQINFEVWRSFVRQVRAPKAALALREVNARWLARAKGWQTERWIKGFVQTLEVGGQTLRLETERDLLQVLRMGSYFDTCLSLEEGSNAASTVVNALDINKHVVYLRNQDGHVVGRKLIGATAAGDFVGYRTYLQEPYKSARGALLEAVRSFGLGCGLRLSNKGTPEKLHDSFWYDDGNEPWEAPQLVAEEAPVVVPADWPDDREALCEAAFVQGRWSWLGQSLDEHDDMMGAARWRSRDGGEAALGLGLHDRVGERMALAGDGRWWEATNVNPYERLCWGRAGLNLEQWGGLVERVEKALDEKLDREVEAPEALLTPSPVLARLDAQRLGWLARRSEGLARHNRCECVVEHHTVCIGTWLANWMTVFMASLASEAAGDWLASWLESGKGLLQEHVSLAFARVGWVGPKALRAGLRSGDGQTRRACALGLGVVGDAGRDVWKLQALARQEPDALEYAVALHRLGDGDAAGRWQAPQVLPLTDGRWCALACELGSASMAAVLMKFILQRCEPGMEHLPKDVRPALKLLCCVNPEEIPEVWETLRGACPVLERWTALPLWFARRRAHWRAMLSAPPAHRAAAVLEYLGWRAKRGDGFGIPAWLNVQKDEPWWLEWRLWQALVVVGGEDVEVVAHALLEHGDSERRVLRAGAMAVRMQGELDQWSSSLLRRVLVGLDDGFYGSQRVIAQPLVAIFDALRVRDGHGRVTAMSQLGLEAWLDMWLYEGRPPVDHPCASNHFWATFMDPRNCSGSDVVSALEKVWFWLPQQVWEERLRPAMGGWDEDYLFCTFNNTFSATLTLWALEVLKAREASEDGFELSAEVFCDEGGDREAWLRGLLGVNPSE